MPKNRLKTKATTKTFLAITLPSLLFVLDNLYGQNIVPAKQYLGPYQLLLFRVVIVMLFRLILVLFKISGAFTLNCALKILVHSSQFWCFFLENSSK